MSIDNSFERIATALETIAAALSGGTVPASQQTVVDPKPAKVTKPAVTGGKSSDAPAASVSAAAEQQTVVAPDAGGVVDLAALNAKVLEVVRAKGREAAVAILNKHGGAKVPEVPAANHPALLADLIAELG